MPIKEVVYESRQQEHGGVPVKIWTADVEKEAREQLINLATLPFVFKHVAVMPDVHAGKGSTVGTVIATKNAIIPAAVGVDIGCGMMAMRLVVDTDRVLDKLKDLRAEIERVVPVGFNGNETLTERVRAWEGWSEDLFSLGETNRLQKAQRQLGSLGGGNHFIEICLDKEKNVWVMLHSGSRNVGKVVAEHYIDKAKRLMDAYFIELEDPDLAYLAKGTREFDEYLHDLHWCQAYAMRNREEMMGRTVSAIKRVLHLDHVDAFFEVNCHHNYTELEHHFNENVWVTRKGAVRARVGDHGIIPGSMGTGSFIVRGLGNAESFCSCSHGAGRRMSRTKARATFTVEDLTAQTNGVECRKDKEVIDEIPGAYKDINQVMANQTDLVEVVAELKQVMCIKG